jgi:hypothetical protein
MSVLYSISPATEKSVEEVILKLTIFPINEVSVEPQP